MDFGTEKYPSLFEHSGFNAPDYDPNSMETDDLPKRPASNYMFYNDKQIPKDAGIVIVDTNFFIDNRNFFNDLVKLGLDFNLLLVIPFTVLQELDGLKFSSNLSQGGKRELLQSIQNLHRYIAEGHPVVRGQRRDQILQDELVKDDQILDCCLFFQSQFPESQLSLLSRDRLLTTKCLIHKIYHVDVSDMSPEKYLVHLAIKSSGCDPSFIAPESFKIKNIKIKPFSTSYPPRSKSSLVPKMYYGEPNTTVKEEIPNINDDLDVTKEKDLSLASSMHNIKLTSRQLPCMNYNAGNMGFPHENPNKSISPKQKKLHKFITDVVNFAEKELSALVQRIHQEEGTESYFLKTFFPPPWTLVQIIDIINANSKLSKTFTSTELTEFDGLLSLTRTYWRLHQFGLEMFIPDIQALLVQIFSLFKLSEKHGRPEDVQKHHQIAQIWLQMFNDLKDTDA